MHDLLGLALVYVRGIWRYRWLVLGLAWVVSLAGWVYVTQIPDEYRASARVHVDTQSVLRPLLSGLAVEPNLNQRIEMMTRTLLTRPNLEQVARATDMHLHATTEAEMEQVIEGLRSGIRLQGTSRENLYTISYNSGNPRQAYDVVQSLLNLFVEGALGGARLDSDMAQRFIDEQLREYERRLEAAERRLAQFRRENVDLLPGTLGTYYQRLEAAQNELRQAQVWLREAENRRDEMQRQLTTGVLEGNSTHSLTPALDERMNDIQRRLDELTLNYTEQHPDIISLRRTLADLERQRNEQTELLRSGLLGGEAYLDDNPIYQQMRMTLSNAQVDVSSLRVRVEEAQRRVDNLQRMVESAPEVEAELKRLDRDYSVNQQNYMALLQRREQGMIAQSVEDRGEQVQFRIIEPARIPLAPSAPNRPVLFAGVLLLGLGVGGGFGFMASQLRPVFDDRRLLNAVTGFPVLGTVSLYQDSGRRLRDRIELLLFGAAGALLLLALGLVVVLGGIHLPIVERLFL